MANEKLITSVLDISVEQESDVEIDIVEIKHLLASEITNKHSPFG